MSKIKLIVADSHEMLRDALVAILKRNLDIEILANASSGREALDTLKSREADIVLLSEDLTDITALDVLRTIQNRYPKTRVIIMSYCTEVRIREIKRYRDSGAASYIHTTSRLETLVRAIKETKASGFFLEGAISKMLIEVLSDEKTNPLKTITFKDREQDVFVMVCKGWTNNQIACKINVTPSAIDYHKHRIYRKTGCKNKSELIVFGLTNNLVTLSDLRVNLS